MLLYKDWKDENGTMHHLSQILGKHTLTSKFKEPQWGHVLLDITPTGFTTGILFYKDKTYELAVNLRDHRIEVITDDETIFIPLKDGKTIKEYDEEIETTLKNKGIDIKINKKPQEVADTTPFDEDTHHHHYNEEVAVEMLKLMQFATKVQSKFISPYRVRKVKPGLFWGTFDIACLVLYNEVHRSFEENMVIESNAFDEHFIEFGFWFGDDNFEGPTFFILPHPFVGENFNPDAQFPEEVYFDEKLGEYMFEIKDMSDETAKKLVEYMRVGYDVFTEYLEWEDIDHCAIPLRMPNNYLDEEWDF